MKTFRHLRRTPIRAFLRGPLAGFSLAILPATNITPAAHPATTAEHPATTGASANVNVDDFGAKGDGHSDDTDAINAALAKAGGSIVEFTAGKTYRVRGMKGNNTGGIAVPDGSHIAGNRATIKLLDHQDQEVWQPCIFRLRESTGITLEGLTLDGNRQKNHPPNTDGDGGGNNIQLESARDIRFINVISRNASTDGLYPTDAWAINGGSKEPTTGLHCQGCIFTENNRQGLSIISLRDADFTDCEFSKTAGKAPQAGVDFENNWPHQVAEEISFTKCRMTENKTFGVVFSMQHDIWAQDISFNDCEFVGNHADQPISLRSNMRNISFTGGQADGKYILVGGLDSAKYDRVVIDGMKLATGLRVRYEAGKITDNEKSLILRNLTFTPSENPSKMGLLTLNNCDGVELQNVAFPQTRVVAIRLMGHITALALRDCTFSGRKSDDSGNSAVIFVRADANLSVDKGVRIQDCRFEHTAAEAMLLDGRGDWTIGSGVTFVDCRGEATRQKSFKGIYGNEHKN